MSISYAPKLTVTSHAAPADIRTALIASALMPAVVVLRVATGMVSHLGDALGDSLAAPQPRPATAPHVSAT